MPTLSETHPCPVCGKPRYWNPIGMIVRADPTLPENMNNMKLLGKWEMHRAPYFLPPWSKHCKILTKMVDFSRYGMPD